jgi:hypothetical protein
MIPKSGYRFSEKIMLKQSSTPIPDMSFAAGVHAEIFVDAQ